MERKLEFTDAALKALVGMTKVDRGFVLEGIRTHLVDNDPMEITRNKFPLKRPSEHAERELRLGDRRVFYTVGGDVGFVLVNLIGQKRGNKLSVAGEEFEL